MDVAKEKRLGKSFESKTQIRVPVYQRPYVWEEDNNWKPLWDSVQIAAERFLPGENHKPVFLGAIVLEKLDRKKATGGWGDIDVRLVIDGQQRLMTIQILLAAARDFCTELGQEVMQRKFNRLTENEEDSCDAPDDAFKVLPANTDREMFKAVLRAGSHAGVRALEGTEGRIPRAYRFFHDRLKAWFTTCDESVEERVQAMYKAVLHGLYIITIELDEDDDSQTIFETLNALGTPLAPADLIKNAILREAQRRGMDIHRLYTSYWKPFEDDAAFWREQVSRTKRLRLDVLLQYVLILRKNDSVRTGELFREFKEHVGDWSKTDPEEILGEIARYAKIYRGFSHYPDGSAEAVFFQRMEQLEITIVFPLLLGVFNALEGPGGSDEIRAILRHIESFIVRRIFCQLTTKNYNRHFLNTLQYLQQNGFSSENLATYLLSERKQVQQKLGESVRWPDDDELHSGWASIDRYNGLKRQRLRILLEALEGGLRSSRSEDVVLRSKLEIEHLLPRQWRDHWPVPQGLEEAVRMRAILRRDEIKNTIGNLTLLTGKLNASISNSAWVKKRKAIEDHTILVLNKSLVKLDQWDEASIEARAETLFDVACRVWPRPTPSSDEEKSSPVAEEADAALGESEDLSMLQEFWAGFNRALAELRSSREPFPLRGQRRLGWPFIGVANRLSIGVTEESTYVFVQIENQRHPECFAQLESLRESIEAELGFELDWKVTEKDVGYIYSPHHPIGLGEPDQWPGVYSWVNDILDAMEAVVGPLMREFVEGGST